MLKKPQLTAANEKPKTRDRILLTSLDLFNCEGEPNVTTVDIANELDISPGNLYYHYKGKDALVTELFSRYHEQMQRILLAPAERPLELVDNWFYLVVVYEQIYRYRFLYRNISLIMQRYGAIQRPFRRLIRQKIDAATKICSQLRAAGVMHADEPRVALLARSIALTITYWFNFEGLSSEVQTDDEGMIHSGVLQVMSLVAPYLGEGDREFMTACLALYKEASK